MQDLTSSSIDRQNVLNNPYALQKMQENLPFGGILWEGDIVFTKQMVALIFEVDERTIDRYLHNHEAELKKNGYTVLKTGKLLKFKELSKVNDIDVAHLAQAIGLFRFSAVLNLAMLLTESERARQIRSRMLDIVMDVVAERSGGNTKYINQRDEGYLLSDFSQKNYRKGYINALQEFVEKFKNKEAIYTNKIYNAVFKEKASEYRKILNLQKSENVRDTMYTEVLEIIASLEHGLAHEIKEAYEAKQALLTSAELKKIFDQFVAHPTHEPYISKARIKMASRDLYFRDVLHHPLKDDIQPISQEDFERFLGEKSMELTERIQQTLEVFKRLKDR